MYWISIAIRAFVVLFLLSLFFINAHNTTPAEMLKKEVKFQKVKEKTYDTFIRVVAFGSVIKDGKQQIYPKVVVLPGKEVRFLNENGKVVSQKQLVHREYIEPGKFRGSTAILSERGNFVGIHHYIGKDGEPTDYFVQEEYIISNDRGEELYEIRIPMEGNGVKGQFLISDKDGSAVGTRIGQGAIDFYSRDGSVRTVPLFGELGRGRREGFVTFSDDGEYVAVLAREIAEPIGGLPSLKAHLWVFLFDKRGKELWRREIDEYQCGNIAISQHGEYLFFKAFTIEGETVPRKGEHRDLASVTLHLFDKEGNSLSFKDTSLFTFGGFSFSPQADYVALTGHHIIRLIRTKDGSIVFEKELPKDVAIRQSLFSSDGEYLIARVKVPIGKNKITFRATPERQYKPVYTQRVFIFDLKGDEIWQKDFSDLKKISSLGVSLVFTFPQRYEIYEEK